MRVTFFIFLIAIKTSKAITRQELYPFGIQDERLPSESDDVSSPEFQLSVPIVFYDTIYKTIFVNDNGILSFLTEVPSFFNSQFPLSYPIIAPMYSDVDIRKSGAVYYRETKEKELVEKANQDIVRHFSRASLFRAQSLFIATWVDVGRYDNKNSPSNTVQVVIASNGNESFAYFLYPENGIQWIQGDGKISNLPDARTQSGFMSGDGRFHILQGSGTDQIRNFDKMSNVNRPGVWLFFIGNLGMGNIIEADIDGNKMLQKNQLQTCAAAQLPCPPTATCTDYSNGFCCACAEGYFGNGRQCLTNNLPLRMNGKVNGLVNDIKIESVDLHAYVVTDEGRSYTAISRIPPNIGFDLQTLVTIGGVIGWLFSSTKSGAPNGFGITGGVFNRTAEVDFPQTGHHIQISEHFLGPDVFNFLRVNLEIRGSLPSIPFGSKIVIDDYEEEYTRVSSGYIRSHASHSFKFGENSLSIPIVIDQTISYDECNFAPINEKHSTLKLSVARNYIVYDSNEQIVRYASTSKVSFLSSEDPCREGRSQCTQHSSCIVEGQTFKCICDRGYESDYRDEVPNALNIANCVDIDECTSARDNCHTFADCVNLPGSYSCRCKTGYSGNGYQCQKELRCEDLNCDPNADCIHLQQRTPECKCKTGYSGDGRFCTKGSETEDCRTYNLCDINAYCIGNPSTERHQCFCKPGYRGDGIVCIEEAESCELLDNCGTDAECISDDESNNAYYCACNQGFVGDGYTCVAEVHYQSCRTANNCNPYAQCIYDPRISQYQCRCNEGYNGDGFQCIRSSVAEPVICNSQNDICSPNADCVGDPMTEKHTCKCKEGFTGDGIICSPNDDCTGREDLCDKNARCLYNNIGSRFECKCNDGYSGDGRRCTPDGNAACNFVNNCHKNASCVFDLTTLKYDCQCNTGFKGDGKMCKEQILSCNIINNCDVKAECKYSFDAQGYRCQCLSGFVGDGFNCRPLRTCREDMSVCDRNAECLYIDQLQTYTCHCRHGFVGDGFECSVAPRHDGDYLIFTQGMSLLRIPLQPTKDNVGQLLLTKPHQIPAGLDVDCLQGYIYWSDVAHGVIYRASYNGSSTETIIEGVLRSPEGISVDWVSRNIYWTDSLKDTIEVAKIDGTMHRTLINEGLVDPRGIVVHPGSGKMYWSDWNRSAPKIEVANLDGSARSVFVDKDLGLPNNLAIDFDKNDLCWTDAGLHKIECISLQNTNRRIIHTPTAYPYDLAIAGNFIYWTDWEIKFIQKISRNGGTPEPLELPLGGNGRVYSIVTIPRQCPRISNACSVNNGGCRHLCLPNGRGRTCMCPEDGNDQDLCNEVR